MSEDIAIPVLCRDDWEMLFVRLRKIAAGYLKKRGVAEQDIEDIVSEWLKRLCLYSKYPVHDGISYAINALSWAHINWGKKHTKENNKQEVDSDKVSEDIPSDDMTPLDLVLDTERSIAMIRVMNLLVDYYSLNGNLSNARLLYIILSVMREDSTLGIIGCCLIIALYTSDSADCAWL